MSRRCNDAVACVVADGLYKESYLPVPTVRLEYHHRASSAQWLQAALGIYALERLMMCTGRSQNAAIPSAVQRDPVGFELRRGPRHDHIHIKAAFIEQKRVLDPLTKTTLEETVWWLAAFAPGCDAVLIL